MHVCAYVMAKTRGVARQQTAFFSYARVSIAVQLWCISHRVCVSQEAITGTPGSSNAGAMVRNKVGGVRWEKVRDRSTVALVVPTPD